MKYFNESKYLCKIIVLYFVPEEIWYLMKWDFSEMRANKLWSSVLSGKLTKMARRRGEIFQRVREKETRIWW